MPFNSNPAAGTPSAKDPRHIGHPFQRFFKLIGPGLITGASDDDPSGIGAYSMAGASFGYTLLWTALVTFPLMAGVQYICAKIGLVCRCGLAAILRQHYPKAVLYPAVLGLLIANTINAAADLMAIAAGVNLLAPIPIPWLILPIGLSLLVLQIWGSYAFIANVFRWLTLALFAYIGAAFLASPDWKEVLKGALLPTIRFDIVTVVLSPADQDLKGALLPTIRFDSAFLSMFVAILGTTISPYLFFWQTNQEDEEKTANEGKHLGRKGATGIELRFAAWDVNAGMGLSNVVMFFIILATAATLHRSGQTRIATATEAAEALRPLAGVGAYVLMALGLIGSGVLAVPILTGSAAYAVAEGFGWKSGLSKRPRRAKEFYLVMGVSTAAALVIDYSGIDAMKALFWTAVINGFLSPPLLVLVMLISSNRAVMGRRVNGPILNVLGWGTALVMLGAAAVLAWTWAWPPS